MGSEPGEGQEEIEEAYVLQYRLGEDLPIGRRKRAIYLLTTIRNLRRLNFPDQKRASEGVEKMDRLLAETRVFHPSEHRGYNELLDFLAQSLGSVRDRLAEKFPG